MEVKSQAPFSMDLESRPILPKQNNSLNKEVSKNKEKFLIS